MYEFLIGAPPFEAEGQAETYQKICNVDLAFPADVPLSREAKDLVAKVTPVTLLGLHSEAIAKRSREENDVGEGSCSPMDGQTPQIEIELK
jgi:hypothetical protein